MVVRKRPISSEQELIINAVIQKGGSPTQAINHSSEPYRLTFRIPLALKNQVDALIASDPVQPSLTAWILEAMKQRLNNEKQNESF
jgi:hypothetical protein